jgi:hypothetical protein
MNFVGGALLVERCAASNSCEETAPFGIGAETVSPNILQFYPTITEFLSRD